MFVHGCPIGCCIMLHLVCLAVCHVPTINLKNRIRYNVPTYVRSSLQSIFEVTSSKVKVTGGGNVKIVLAHIFVKNASIHVKPRPWWPLFHAAEKNVYCIIFETIGWQYSSLSSCLVCVCVLNCDRPQYDRAVCTQEASYLCEMTYTYLYHLCGNFKHGAAGHILCRCCAVGSVIWFWNVDNAQSRQWQDPVFSHAGTASYPWYQMVW